ncbi:DapH/DapD/GlmU-related protein [Vibrio sp. 10N.286.46.A8]|uniref:acyltransferase n=1 Tax=Vibrio sp. 10N.286.46.A8 TaxID=3229697 RepID=UPI003551AA1B
MKKNILRFGFLHYSYLINIIHAVIYILPPVFRPPFWCLLLGKYNQRVFIDSNVYFRYPSTVYLGKDVSINRGCEFYTSWYDRKTTKIDIGNNVRIGPGVRFFSAGHDINNIDLPDNSNTISVGDNVWIGGGATILQGVTVGDGAVIAAGSVVNRDVLPLTLVAGVPAKFVKNRMIRD